MSGLYRFLIFEMKRIKRVVNTAKIKAENKGIYTPKPAKGK